MNTAKAIKIVEDAIAQLKAKKYKAESGIYCYIFDSEDTTYNNKKNVSNLTGKQLQNTIKKAKTCQVCALGSLFTSAVSQFNSVSGFEFEEAVSDPDSIFESKLTEFFDRDDLLLAEYVFERGDCGKLQDMMYNNGTYYTENNELPPTFSKALLAKAREYGDKYPEDDDRLMIILQNFKRNKGRFVLPQRIR